MNFESIFGRYGGVMRTCELTKNAAKLMTYASKLGVEEKARMVVGVWLQKIWEHLCAPIF